MLKSEILNEGLKICEMACSMRKNIALQKKQMDLETDEDVVMWAPKHWDDELTKIEGRLAVLAEHIKSHTNWSFYDFWNKRMKMAIDFDKDIHFFPNRVVKFLDWMRYTINNSLN